MNLRNALVLLGGVVGASAVSALVVVGCSSGGSSSPSADAGNDSPTQPDVTTDHYVGPDVIVNETGTDANDGGTGDAEGGMTPGDFLTASAIAFCNQFQKCCGATSFNKNACISAFIDIGLDNTGVNAQAQYLTSAVTVDQTKAQSCIADINAIDCTANIVTSAQWKKVLSDCVGGLVGTLGTGAACTAPVQCNSSSFCDLPLDGGTTGTCQPLRGVGAPCGDFGGQTVGQSDEACSYRRSGSNGQFCFNTDLNLGTPIDGGPAAWTCQNAVGLDAGCIEDINCTTSICDLDINGGTCTNQSPFIYSFECTAFPLDAGGD
jgi:hypothetical protein